MKKLFVVCIVLLSAFSLQLQAQNKQENTLGYFNSLSIGVNAGTTGWGIDVATPIGQYLSLRAGVTFMPNFTISDDVDVDVDFEGYHGSHSIDVEGGIKRTSGEILLNFYPFKRSSFFITGGAAFGGDKIIKLKGHSDELAGYSGLAGIEIGDYLSVLGLEDFYAGKGIWVIDNGEIVMSSTEDNFFEHRELNGGDLAVSRTDGVSNIVIDRQTYNKVQNGINVVIYDNLLEQVVDAVGFDGVSQYAAVK